jgi:hypothetical protein
LAQIGKQAGEELRRDPWRQSVLAAIVDEGVELVLNAESVALVDAIAQLEMPGGSVGSSRERDTFQETFAETPDLT